MKARLLGFLIGIGALSGVGLWMLIMLLEAANAESPFIEEEEEEEEQSTRKWFF